MVVGIDAELAPAVRHGEEAQMVVFEALLRDLAEAEAIEDIVFEQQFLPDSAPAEDGFSGRQDALPQLVSVAGEHELEELRDGLGVLLDLLLGVWVQDGEAGVDVPFVGVDAQGDVDLDVLDAADVARVFPRELLVRLPRGAHAEECGVRDGLRVCRDTVVLFAGEIDMLGA